MDSWVSARAHKLDNWTYPSTPDEMEILTEEGMLSLAVVLGSSLSLVGLVFAFITYSLFSDLRSVAGTTLMNLLASLFLTQLLFVVGAGGVHGADLCVSLSLALHYSRLTVVCWLFIATHDLYRSVKTYSGLIDCPPPTLATTFCKYSVLGWGLPAAFLGIGILIQNHGHGLGESAAEELRSHNCWFPSNRTFFFTFLLPYCFLLVVTIYYTVQGVIAIRWAAAFAPSRKAQEKMTRRRRLQLFLFTRIVAYVFVVVSSGGISLLMDSKLAWAIFACSSALQGIFIALSVTCNCQVLKLYTRTIRSRHAEVNYGAGSEMAKSGSLQLLTWDPLPDTV